MASLKPVDNDPFAQPAQPNLVPVDHDPFAQDAPQQRSLDQEAGRQIGLTGRYLVEGALSLPEVVGDAANSVINVGSTAINKMAGTHIPMLPSMTGSVNTLLNATGLPHPETKIEKVVAEPSKLMASLPSYVFAAPVTGVKELAPLANDLKSQLYGAAGAGTALGITKQHTDNPAYQLAASIAGGMAGAGVANLTDKLALAKEAAGYIPSNDQLKTAAKSAYKAADDAGVIIKPEAVQNLSSGIKSDLAEFGYHPQLQPKVATVLGEIDRISAPIADEAGNAVGQNVTSKQIQILRRMANSAVMSSDPSEQTLGKMIVGKLDSFMEGIGPNDVVQGNAGEAADQLQRGAQLWSRFRKSEAIDRAAGKADLQAASTGSGGNVANATRQAIKNILNNPKAVAGYTPDEVAEMNRIVRGGAITNGARLIGKLSPGGNGLMTALNIGAAAANPLLAIPGVAGIGAKAVSDRSTMNAVQDLSRLVRAGGSKELLNALTNPSYIEQPSITQGSNAVLLRSLLAGGNEASPYLRLFSSGQSQASGSTGTNTRRQP